VLVNAENPAAMYDYTALLHNFKMNEGTGLPLNLASAETAILDPAASWALDEPYTPTAHQFVTSYAYNSLNQVVKQNTPDGGISEFWYDRLGRLTISQNAEQKNASNGDASNRFSYTKYDALGRIIEVGEKLNLSFLSDADMRNDCKLNKWLFNLPATGSSTDCELASYSAGTDRQITVTRYNTASNTGAADGRTIALPSTVTQDNLRNRVAATFYIPATGQGQQFASYYTYDISGNVKTLWQQLVPMTAYDGSGMKRIDYNYDLVSGKVNHVWYQRGKRDQYYYYYSYDMENRLLEAYSGRNKDESKVDASYKYYLHGPLARTELGDEKLQGVDYAYTLQGWLKGVNSTLLNPDNDMGKDGAATGSHTTVARDVYAFGLNYNEFDYKAVAGSTMSTNTFLPYTFRTKTDPVGRALYNGNIAAISLALYKLDNGKTTGYSYGYDQLNRLVNMRKNIDEISNGGTASSWTYLDGPDPASINDNPYGEQYSYDANGNIMTLHRNGAGTATSPLEMDKMKYSYYYKKTDGSWGEWSNDMLIMESDIQYMTNRLYRVRDNVAANKYTTDIDNQSTVNYQYDNIGNMTSDAAEGITSIKWTVYGKIQTVTKVKGGVTTTMDYYYDVSGNRVMKKVNNKLTFYIRDAQGNVLGVYTGEEPVELPTLEAPPIGYTWAEQHLYGGGRLGMYTPRAFINNPDTDEAPSGPDDAGLRTYELSNHLGNVHVTIADIKREVIVGSTSYYIPEILTTSDYYPFGMLMPERHGYKVDGGWASGNDNINGNNLPQQLTIDHRETDHPAEYKASQFIEFVTGFNSGTDNNFLAYIADGGNTAPGNTAGSGGEYNVYRYGFNGKENDREINNDEYDFGARIYDGRLGRWLSMDPLQKKYADLSPYSYCFNNPILFIDPNGKEVVVKDHMGNTVAVYKSDGSVVISKGMENSVELHSYQQARTYLAKASSSMQAIEKSNRVLTINMTSGNSSGIGTFTPAATYTEKDGNHAISSMAEAETAKFSNSKDLGSIQWNPELGAVDGELNKHSPASILDHEFKHANHALTDLLKYAKNVATPTTDGTDNVEEQVTIAEENATSILLNNGDGNYGKRKTHHPPSNTWNGAYLTESSISIIQKIVKVLSPQELQKQLAKTFKEVKDASAKDAMMRRDNLGGGGDGADGLLRGSSGTRKL
jgi:RHS repeat-associated protein